MTNEKDQRASFGESVGSMAGAILLILSIRWLLFEPYVIPSGSMIPTLLIHDHILVNKLAYGVRVPFTKKWLLRFSPPQRGEIIVFRSVGEEEEYFMIKRVIGVAGDVVEVGQSGEIAINGTPIERRPMPDSKSEAGQELYYSVNELDLGNSFEVVDFYEEDLVTKKHRILQIKDAYRFGDRKFTVPEGHLFMMGDNRDNSKDSRFWGPLPLAHVVGRATYVWLSCDETIPYLPFLCNPLKVRTKRFFHRID